MRIWKKIEVCGHTITVKLVPGDHFPHEQDGETHHTSGTILLTERPEHPSRVMDTFLHELCHVVWEANGIENYMKTHFRLTYPQVRRIEEQIIRMLVPGLLQGMRGAGLLSRRVIK